MSEGFRQEELVSPPAASSSSLEQSVNWYGNDSGSIEALDSSRRMTHKLTELCQLKGVPTGSRSTKEVMATLLLNTDTATANQMRFMLDLARRGRVPSPMTALATRARASAWLDEATGVANEEH